MASKKEYLYTLEGQDAMGGARTFRVYKKGRSRFIDEHLVHPSNRSDKGIRKELELVFGVQSVRKVNEST
jgi:hypothetical protein